MNWVAWKMLTGDRAKYFGIVFGEAFDNLTFVRIVFVLQIVLERLMLGPFLALEGLARGDDLAHRRFDAG